MDSQWELLSTEKNQVGNIELSDGARVGVVGGGPAGSFFSYFLLDFADRVGMELDVEIYEPRDFSRPAPQGCNMCGGIISESLVQHLATDGISLPTTLVQRGIESYHLHTDCGSVLISTPLQEKRIAAVHRGAGPRDIQEFKWRSFDGHLQGLAVDRGARVIRQRVIGVDWVDNRPNIKVRSQPERSYELVVLATGVNGIGQRIVKGLGLNYEPPTTSKTMIREYYLGEDVVRKHLGSAMHVFLLDIPRLEFAAIIPKGDYASVCLLGHDIDRSLIETFLNSAEVTQCFPADFSLEQISCNCSPRINVAGAKKPFADRVVFVGDCAVTRLYKDGIGGAYRTAKAAAATAIFQGISANDFEEYYLPVCEEIRRDNDIGKLMFVVTRQIQRRRVAKQGVLHMTRAEQKQNRKLRMSMVLWDMFTGSAPYTDVFRRTMVPTFWGSLLWYVFSSVFRRYSPEKQEAHKEDFE
jgi:flavin-dependent dehydrogenase